MTQPACVCGQPANDATICADCTHDLQLALIAAAILGPQLDVARSRQARFTEHNGSSSFSHPLPYDVRSAAAADTLANELGAWVRIIRSPADGDWPADTIDAMAMWMLRRGTRIRQHPAAADMLHTISQAVRDAQRVIDRPPSRVYAGPCPHCHHDLLSLPGRTIVYCRNCGEPSVIAERQEAMRQALEDHLGNASYAARACTGLGLPVTPEIIRKWAERGKLVTHGGLYRIGDVITIALDQRAKLAQRGQ